MKKSVSVFSDFKLGIQTYFKSFAFIRKHKMWSYYLDPILFILLFAMASFIGFSSINDLVTPYINDLFGVETIPGDGWWEKTLSFLKNAGKYLGSFVLWLTLAFIYYKVSKYVVLICMSPIMAFVSERTEKELTGREYPFVWSQFFKDILRGVLIALRNLFVEIGFIIALSILNLLIGLVFPPAAFITSPVLAVVTFLIGAYYYGFSTMDYTNERHKRSVGESIQLIRQHKGLAMANGSIFTLWLIIPVFGTYIGTIFAPIHCTIGATMAMHELEMKTREVKNEVTALN
ncbi:MAG: EI24 domain-containing protein [Flavobacteriales bacterium]|nr:EI24 domain-containing protein [Flavobacteriales bacterium]